MSEYMQLKEPNAFRQPKARPNQNTAEQTRKAQLRELEYNLTRKPMYWLTQKQAEENRNVGLSTFVVPEGWSLNQIADHLNVSIEELKTRNNFKLQNWNGVEGFFTGEKIVYSTKSGSGEKEEEEKEVAENPEQIISKAYSSYANDELTMPEFSKAIMPYVESHGSSIATLLVTGGMFNPDSLALALAENSPKDSDLARFDRALLETMSIDLNTHAAGNREENLYQKQRIDKILKLNLTHQAVGLKEIIDNEKGQEEKIKQIIAYVREQFEEYPPKVKAFKNQDNYNEEEKLKILGKVAALTGRIEVLMGSIFYKGSSHENTWETKGANKGDDEFLKYYQMDMHGTSQQGSQWCAMFVASILNEVLGFAPVDKNGNRSAQKKYGWYTWDVTSLHDSVNYQLKEESKYDTRHIKKITNDQFFELRKKISIEKSLTKRYELVKGFFANSFIPQPGDLLAVGSKNIDSLGAAKNGKPGFNHSTMIEKYIDDSTNNKIYISTIEGNADQRAGGRLIELTKCENNGQKDLSFVTQISRVGLSNYGVGVNIDDGTKDQLLVKDESKQWSENDLINPLIQMSNLLQEYSQKKKYVKPGNHNKSIASIVQNDATGSTN